MIGLIKLALQGTRRASGTEPTITAGMDSFIRPLPAPGLSAAEQILHRSTPLTRRNSFDGDMDHLNWPASAQPEPQQTRGPAMMFAPRAQAAMPPPSLVAQHQAQQRPVRGRAAQTPSVQANVPRFVDARSRQYEVIQFVTEIDQLESNLRGQMGWLAIDGVRNLTSVSMGVASVLGLVFSIIALTLHHVMPGLGIIVFASLVVGGVVIGVLAQTLARWLWAKRNDTAPLRAELNDIRERLMRQAPNGRVENLLDTEIRLLRRLERLEVRLDGGFFNTLGDALIGTFGWDPRLGDMLGRAAKSRKAAVKRAANQSAYRQAQAQAGGVLNACPYPARAQRNYAQPARRPAGPPRSASEQSRAQSSGRRPTAMMSQHSGPQAPGNLDRRMPLKRLQWTTNGVRAAQPHAAKTRQGVLAKQ